ncbi:MAG: bifunctional [glutamate--ammonia ligase]-adenylyl-L-tyrosine phosphorylase/[glutamate--ammonia-ligase] adenylyltransferase [Planctomycetes bacterium]|nr:bifunctional [glutamate--ammonia ligase]-adenylyl-L-tyrosine phosphorylase/[glutamate--ammonia-ligase] adenylyltransferase [Planctomycetota bacterium]
MDRECLSNLLERPETAASVLRGWKVEDPRRAHQNLLGMARAGMTLDLLAVLCGRLEDLLKELSDPDMALNNLEHFVQAARNPLSIGSLFQRDPESLKPLLQIFSTSQYLSDWLVRDREAFDLLRLTAGEPVPRGELIKDICSDVAAAEDEQVVMMILRGYRHRETLRIAYGDIVRGQSLETVTTQISYLADAIIEAAVQAAWRFQSARRGLPRLSDGTRARFTVLGMGKLGGNELNYSSDIDLIFLSDGDGKTDGGRPVSNVEFFDRLAQQIVKLLTEPTKLGSAYRVDLRLRPAGRQGSAVMDVDSALRYYDLSGRTWERQAFVKARTVAGDAALGDDFLARLEPWIYRRYLGSVDIAGIKALKRQIEQRAHVTGVGDRDIKNGEGGIRAIEFVIQFLQLLNGGDLKAIRTGNTLKAIDQLKHVGCLSTDERQRLEENYRWLRKIEHRLQILFDLQTHTLPDNDSELHRLALRIGYEPQMGRSALDCFKADLAEKRRTNRVIFDHLLQDAFSGAPQEAAETDLILDPHPPQETIHQCLARYRFRDIPAAYANLMALGNERVPFLSTRRCRHFLASIAPKLLRAIAATPDPDFTLLNLNQVSDSLGGKGVLWELFSFNPPSLRLYVRLCASSPYLSGILTSNPGMIDELMDSLVRDQLPTYEALNSALSELSRGAEDSDPILHSFKNCQHLRVGVRDILGTESLRDILGKENLRDTHRALSDTAEVLLQQIARREWDRMVQKLGTPTRTNGNGQTVTCELVIISLGKLGGREPNYHSDLDLVFLFEDEGQTRHPRQRRDVETSNQHFFGQLSQRIITTITRLGPFGRLYDVDPRLRPTGKSGSLALSLGEFERYFLEGRGQLWERQALCKARAVFGSPPARAAAMDAIHRIITGCDWQSTSAEEIRHMRIRMQQSASDRNLKRGVGGTVDIEFIVQMLQIKCAADCPQVLIPGTLDAIDALHQAGALTDDDARYLSDSYGFLRSVESGLRLMNTAARHDLPVDDLDLEKLAFLIGHESGQKLVENCSLCRRKNRACFDRIFDEASRANRL